MEPDYDCIFVSFSLPIYNKMFKYLKVVIHIWGDIKYLKTFYNYIFMKTLTSMKLIEGNIQGFILSIVGVAIVLAVGLIIIGEIATNQQTANVGTKCGRNATNGAANPLFTNCGSAYNATNAISAQMATIPQWVGIIITVSLAFIVLGYFYNRM